MRWKDGPKQSGAEGQAACVSCAFEAQARSPSQDDHDAHVHIHLHQSLNLRQDLEERKSPHNPPSHLRQRKTGEPVQQESSTRRSPHLQKCRSPPATQSWTTDDRGGREEGWGKMRKLERRELEFCERLKAGRSLLRQPADVLNIHSMSIAATTARQWDHHRRRDHQQRHCHF